MPTPVPAGGDWEQPTSPQLSEAQTLAGRQRSGIVPVQAMTVRVTGATALLVRQAQLSCGGVVSTTVTVWLQ